MKGHFMDTPVDPCFVDFLAGLLKYDPGVLLLCQLPCWSAEVWPSPSVALSGTWPVC